MKAPYKRRNFFINKEFQGKYIFQAFLFVAAGSILFALIFSFFSSNTLSIVYDNYHLRLGITPRLLINKILSTQWVFILLGGFFICVMTLFISHRIAGPFFRFEKTLDKMVDKDLSVRIHLRPKDVGKDLALKINHFNEIISSQLNLIIQSSEAIIQSCETITSAGDHDKKDVIVADINEIKQQSRDILEITSKFKLFNK